MPYISKTKQERASWMTLREAVEHVCLIEKCSTKDALHQIVTAVNDHEVGAVVEDSEGQPIRWQGPMPPEGSGASWAPQSAHRLPLHGLDERKIQPKTFEIPAVDEASLTQKGRKLLAAGKLPEAEKRFTALLRREAVFRIWGGKPKVVALDEQRDTRSKGGRPTRRQDIETILRGVCLDQPDKTLIDLVQTTLGNGPGLSDDVIRRTIAKLRHPTPER